MRILSILPFSPPSAQYGGAERQMHSLHKGLQAKGVDIHVLADIAAVRQRYQVVEGIPVWGVPFPVLTSHALRPGNFKLWKAWRSIRKTVLTQIPRPDLIQVSTFRQPAMIGHWLASSMNLPYVVRLACSGSHGDMKFAHSNWLTRLELPKIVRSVSRVVALDSATRQEAIDSGVPAERIEIIPNAPALHKVSVTLDEPRDIVFIGRLAPQKRIDSVLVAYSQLQDMAHELRPLLIAGDGADRAKLEKLARQLKIADQCTFLGDVPRPEEVLDRACCFINSSESEGLPNAVLEALAFGVPVILSDIPVHRELAAAVGMEDFLFPVGESRVLASRLRNFLGLPESDKCDLRQRCAEYARRFTPAVRDDAYVNLYHRILAERKEKC
jgi:glycosyltransferase involved in cell wall biosynthesis